MNIPSSDPYQHLMQYQQPNAIRPPATIQPIEERPDLITIPEFEKPELSPETRLELKKRLEEKLDDTKESYRAQRDALRELTVGYVGVQSKKTQWEIYLSGMSEGEVGSDAPSGVEFYQMLRDIQQQNNTIKAYAAYGENALRA
ncbi:hypothetical protein [Hydrogenimonas sp.]